MSDSNDFSDVDCEHVLTGRSGRVLILGSLVSDFMALDTRKQAQLMSRMKLWADGVPLTKEQFNGNEGRCGGDNDRMLVAVKTNNSLKVRLYGFVRHLRSVRTLLIVDIDDAKKQDKASPRILMRARAKVVSLDERCGD